MLINQALAILMVLGLISAQDAQLLENALAQCVAGVFLITVNAYVVVQYIKGRVALKQGEARPTTTALLVGALILLVSAPAEAAPLLPWRAQVEQRLQEQHRLIEQLIGQQSRPLSPGPGPIYQLPIPGEPKQLLPTPGDPKQQVPIGGEPRQTLPPGGDPKQPLPLPGEPRQIMPPAANGVPQSYTFGRRALARPID
jgi:hypothetical protein